MIGIYYGVDEQNIEYSGVVYSYPQLYEATYNPGIDWDILILDRIKDGTYEEKKAQVRDLAIEYSNMYDIPECITDIFEIEAWFFKYGMKYGLLKEFHENCIC